MAGWARASSVERLLECPGPGLLPVCEEERSPRTMEAAAWGKLAHHWKATGEVKPDPDWPRLAGHFEAKLRANGLQGDAGDRFREEWWPSSMGRHEVAVAIDCDGSRRAAWAELGGDDAAWKAKWGPSWLTGTLDYVGELLGDPLVRDLKTGRWMHEPDSPQLKSYALAALLLRMPTEPPPSRIVLAIDHWPRYPVIGLPTAYWHEASPEDLDDFYRRLTLRCRLLNRLKKASGEQVRAELRAGEWCRWCPVAGNCPAVNEN